MRKSLTTRPWSLYIMGVICIFLCSCSLTIKKKSTTEFSLDSADDYYEKGQWDQAIIHYRLFLSQHPQNSEARIKLGKALLADHRIEEAKTEFEKQMGDNSVVSPEIYFLAGRSCHQLGLFDEAEAYYRTYLRKEKDANLGLVSYFLKQTGAAKTAGEAGTSYLVENLGQRVNSLQDEFHPVYSPTLDQRFYFSVRDLERTSAIRGTPSVGSSMKFAEIARGTWTIGGALDQDLMGDDDLYLLDFSEDGQTVFFTKSLSAGNKMTYRKNFEELPGEQQVDRWTHPIYNSMLGDRDLFMIHDSAFLFSSSRLESYGGFDLYVTFKRLGKWMVQNLGPDINSQFDEISPFLSKNGRELYFSSNSDKSIGGYDIFFATFDDDMESWSTPQNMLPPLNSGMDDVGFRISLSGREALFSSDRSGGHGGFDIYQVYFDQKRYSQSEISQPKYFYQVSEYRSFASQGERSSIMAEKPIYALPVISFGERPVVITPKIKDELEQVLKFGRLFPHTGLLLHVFTGGNDLVDDFSLFRPVLILKNLVDFLKENGMDPSRIQIRLYGNQYPRFTSQDVSDDQPVVPARSMNRRLEFGFTRTTNLPVQFSTSIDKVTHSALDMSPYQIWLNNTQELYFRIKLLETKQLLKGADYIQEDDYMLVKEENGENYTYYSGIFQDVASAKEKLAQYIARGFLSAEIVAFEGASKIESDQITTEMIENYPQLKEYIIYQK